MARIKVLVVDDSAVMRRNMRTIIMAAGHEVVAEAADGEAAFSVYAAHKPDLVTMDITMPKVDGLTALKNILESFPDAKIIMVTSLDQEALVMKAIKSGAKNYLLKPIHVEKAKKAINDILL